MNLTTSQLELLLSLRDGAEHQVRVTEQTPTGRSGGRVRATRVRAATIAALRERGFITVNQERYREASQGRSTYVTETYARITTDGSAVLAGAS